MKKDWSYVIGSPLLAAVATMGVYFRHVEYGPGFTATVVVLSFFLGLTMKTKGEQLLSEKLDRMKKELEDELL
jgi:hypothetical protein